MGLVIAGGIGTVGVIKVIGSVATLTGCIVGWNRLPDNAFRRKLNRLYRTGDICIKKEFKKQDGKPGFRKIYPFTPIKNIKIYHDHIKATIILPDGLDPKTMIDNTFLFKQVFGEFAHLEQKTQRIFQLSVWPKDLNEFLYEAKEVLSLVKKMRLPVYAGLSRTGNVVYDMIDYPHLLIAGETGSGKSVALRQVLTTWLLHNKNLVLYCADLKLVEFHVFQGVAKKVVYDESGLREIIGKMEKEAVKRGKLMQSHGVAHVDDLPKDAAIPYIVIAIDEVAMLESKEGKAIMARIAKVIAIGRALGIFFVMSMQRPDREVLPGKIKNCLTVRMAFRHTDITNSQISLGGGHTEAADIQISQKGRAALLLEGVEFVQAPYLGLEECKDLLARLKAEREAAPPVVEEEEEEDDFEPLPGGDDDEEEEEPLRNVVPMRMRDLEDDEDEDDDAL